MAEEEEAEGVAPREEVNLQELLESMLSKQNLVTDPFLSGNMNAQMYIPVKLLLQHANLKDIADEEGLLAAADNSSRLAVSEDRLMIRPMLKSKRNTVILRGMPEDTTEDDIREIFSPYPAEKNLVKKVTPDINNTWFVKLAADDQMQEVLLWLRSQTFRGEKISAAIKSEHFLRSFFPVAGAIPQGSAAEGDWSMAPMGMPEIDHSGPQPMPGYWQPWGMRTELGLGAFLYGGSKGSAKGGKGWQDGPPGKGGWGQNWSGGDGDWNSGWGGWGKSGWGKSEDDKGKGGKGGKGKEAKRKKADGKGKKSGEEGEGSRRRPKDGKSATPKVDDERAFPALPGQQAPTPIQRGYKDENFKRYSRDQIEGIFAKVDFSSVTAPEFELGEVFLEEPCKEFAPEASSSTVSYKDKAAAVA